MKRWLWVGIVAVFILFVFASLTTAEEATPAPTTPLPMATIDRLAAPATVPSPTQADEGAQLYWLNCQPCHGDWGQGLTDEWRAQFPEEDQNCWQSGCHGTHGKEPPPEGFVLPTVVPALVGEGNALARFGTLAQLYHYMRIKMPYEAPGRLPEEEYLAITAFLARAHGFWDGRPLTLERMETLSFEPAASDGPAQVSTRDDVIGEKAPPALERVAGSWAILVGGLAVGLIFSGGVWLWRRTQRKDRH